MEDLKQLYDNGTVEDSEPRGLSSYLIVHSAGAGLRIQLGGTGINYQFIWRPFFTKKGVNKKL